MKRQSYSGEEYKPFAYVQCKVLLVEPKGVVNIGNAGGELTAGNDVWIWCWSLTDSDIIQNLWKEIIKEGI